MRKAKWILSGLAAFLIALVVAAYAIIASYPVEEIKTLLQAEVKKTTGRDLTIAGKVEMEVSFSPSIVMEDITFANAEWASEPNMVTMKRFEVEVELWPLLSGEIAIKRLVMVEPVIQIETDAEGRGNWEAPGIAGGEDTQAGDLGVLPSFDALAIEQGRLVLRDQASGITQTIVLESLEGSAQDLASPLTASIKGSVDEIPFDLAIELGSIAKLVSGEAFPLSADGTLAGAQAAIKGTLAPKFDGQMDLDIALSGASFADLNKAFAIGLPAEGAYDLKLDISQAGADQLNINSLNLKIANSDLSGTAAVDLAGERPRVTGAFASQRFAVADFFGPSTSTDQGLLPSDPIPIEFLTAADMNLTISVGELALRATTITQAQTTFVVENGLLKIDPMSFNYSGGSFAGRLSIDGNQSPPAVAIAFTGKSLDMAQLLTPEWQGRGDLEVDVSGRGQSWKEVGASLNGTTELSAAGGRLDNKLLAIVSASLIDLMGPLLGGESSVAVNCAIARFNWSDGIGVSNGSSLDTSSFTSTANGTISLKSETLDLYVDTWTKTVALAALAVPIHLTGPILNPSAAPDPAGTAKGLAKTVGLIVFPPAGIAAIIADKNANQTGGNACVAAVEQVDAGGGPQTVFDDIWSGAGDAADSVGDAVEGAAEGAGEVLEDTGDAIEEGIQDLFGN